MLPTTLRAPRPRKPSPSASVTLTVSVPHYCVDILLTSRADANAFKTAFENAQKANAGEAVDTPAAEEPKAEEKPEEPATETKEE